MPLAIATDMSAVASSPSDPSSKPFVVRPGVVVDPTAGRLYMMNPQGGIDAVEIASGKLLWSTTAAAKPLITFDGKLLAQGEATRGSHDLPIVALDARDGSRHGTVGLPMPAGVMPTVGDSFGTASSLTATIVGGEAIVGWDFSQAIPSGVWPPQQPTRRASGAFSLGLKSLAVAQLSSEQAAAKIASSRPAAVAASSLLGAQGLYIRPERADQFFVGVQIAQAKLGLSAVLKRWNAASGAALPDISLGSSYAASAVSADGANFLAVTNTGGTPPRYLWSIYAIFSGQQVAQLPLSAWAPPFSLWHSILVFESMPFARPVNGVLLQEPLALHGLDLGSSREIWKRALRDTTYRGPRPPQP